MSPGKMRTGMTPGHSGWGVPITVQNEFLKEHALIIGSLTAMVTKVFARLSCQRSIGVDEKPGHRCKISLVKDLGGQRPPSSKVLEGSLLTTTRSMQYDK